MSEITKEEVIAYLSALRSSDLQDLILELEDRWGIERLATQPFPVHMGMPIEMGVPCGLTLILRDAGERRIPVMRTLRELFGVGLREAKSMVEAAGELVLAEDLDRDEVEAILARLREVGAKVEVT